MPPCLTLKLITTMKQRSALPYVSLSMVTHKCLSTILRLMPPVCGIGVLLSLSPLSAADRSWTNASGGDFDTGTNWSGNTAPSVDDKVVLDLDATYSIKLNAGVTNQAMDISAGTVEIDLDQNAYALSGKLTIIQSASQSPSLTFQGGTFSADEIEGRSAQNSSIVPYASLNFTGATTVASVATLVNLNTLNNTGFVRMNVLDGASFSMPNLAAGTDIFNMTWRSEFNVSGEDSSADINGRFNMVWANSVVRVQDGGQFSANTVRIAQRNLSDHTIFVDGSGSLFEVNGDIRFADGTGPTSKGTVLVTNGGSIESNSAGRANRDGVDVNLVVSGSGSTWDGTNFYIGGLGHAVANRRGTGTMIVADGGVVSATRATIHAEGILTGNGTVETSDAEGILILGGTVRPGVYAYSHTFGIDSSATETFSLSPAIGTLVSDGNVEFVVAVDGDDTFTPTLNIRVAGGVDGADQLNVLGDLTLAGILDIVAFDEPVLAANDMFTILNWSGTLTGTFSQINAFDPGSGLSWDFDNLYVDGTISVIPEPAGVALLLSGVIALAVVLRRRR